MLDAVKNVNFAGVAPQINAVGGGANSGLATIPVQKSDEFVKQGEDEKKKKLSTGAKVGIGAGVLATIGLVAAAVLTRGKNIKSANLVEHIDFQSAKTTEEAVQFVKDHFGMQYAPEAQKDMSLEMMNFVNKGLTQFNNVTKGKYRPANFIEYSAETFIGENASAMARVLKYHGDQEYYSICFNPKFFENIDKKIVDMINEDISAGALRKINDRYTFDPLNRSFSITNETEDKIAKYLQGKCNLEEKIELTHLLYDLSDANVSLFEKYSGDLNKLQELVGTNIVVDKTSPFHVVYHEIAHIYHELKDPKMFSKMRKLEELKQAEITDFSILNEFKSKYQGVASQVSEYAMESPDEFVAEVYAKMIDGKKFSNEVLKLYKKYGGPELPNM